VIIILDVTAAVLEAAFSFLDSSMQIYILEIIECWWSIENDQSLEQRRKKVFALTEKDDILPALMKWIEEKSTALDDDLCIAARAINVSKELSDWEKVVQIGALFNRFSKFAAEQNLTTRHNWSAFPTRLTWAEISSIETKLLGSVFE